MALPQEGKFKIRTVGPVKEGVSKKSGKPYKVFDIQFEDEEQWYSTFWTEKESPNIGMELEGKKSYDGEYESYKFEIKRQNGASSWNPTGANATMYGVASQMVRDMFELGVADAEEWSKKRKKGESAVSHYVRTVAEMAALIKPQILAMGGSTAEVKQGEQTSAAPSTDGDPGPQDPGNVDSWPAGEVGVDLGSM